MQREGIVNGVNQTGKVWNDEEKVPVAERRNPLCDGLYRALTLFGNIMCPIKKDKKGR